MKNRLLGLMLVVIAFDFGITLAGQPPTYWHDPHTAREGTPLFAWFMVRGISWYLAFIAVYMASAAALIRVLPRQTAIVVGLVFLFSHYFAACTWLSLRFDFGMIGPIVYAAALSSALVSILKSGPLGGCLTEENA
jgi:hypothetical protein